MTHPSDPDIGDTFTYQLVTGDGADNNDAFTITGNSLQINSSPDFETQSSYSIRVQTTDSVGASYSEAFTINVNNVNESPTDLVLSNSSIDENFAENSAEGAVVGTFSTSDPDIGDTFTYQLVTGDGADDNDAFTITGNSLQINSSPDFETQSSYSIRVQTTDSVGNSYSEALTISVNDVPEPPTSIVLSNSSIDSNSSDNAVVGTFSTSDPDIGDTFTYQLVTGDGADDNDAFTITGNSLQINSSPDFETQSSYSIRVQTTDSVGNSYSEALTISVNDVPEPPTSIVLSNSSIDSNSSDNAVVGTFSTSDPDIGDTFTYQLVTGDGADDNDAFTITGNSLQINSSPDFETQSSYSIRVQTTDSVGNSYSEALTISVNDVPEPPTSIVLSNSSIDSNSSDNAVVGTFSTSDPDIGDTFTYQLVTGDGADDNDAFTITGNSLQINSSPDFETQSSYSIRVQTTDSVGASYSEAFTINVNNVNESPTDLVLSNSSIDSNSSDNAVVGTFSTSDPDIGDTFTYQLVTGDGADDNDAFTITGNSLQINSSPDFETQSSYSIRVQTTDSVGASYSEAFTINVNNVNEFPTDLVLSNSSIDSNSSDNAVVGTFSTSDPDIGDTFTYQLVTGDGADDNDAFTITGNSLQINSSPDFETQSSYSIRVQTTDSTGASYSEAFTISVKDINESPTSIVLTISVKDVPEPPTSIVLSNSSIDSNSSDNAVVGTFSTSDPDIGDTFTYQLVTGDGADDNDAFTITGNSLQINSSPDFETQSSYSIRVQTTDSTGASYSEAFTISVNDINESPTSIVLTISVKDVPEPPTSIVFSNSSIDSNSSDNAVVGTFSTSDPDSSDPFTYQLVTGDGADDNDAFTITGNSLQINSSPDFETQSSYSIRVQTTDSTGASYSEAFTISVNDVPEPPTSIVLTISVNDVPEPPTSIVLSSSSIDENSPDNAVVGTFSTTDPDSSDPFTYQLVTGDGADDNAAFTIVGNSLQINSSPDFETQSSYSIRVQTTDSTGASYSEAFTISVNDVPEPPTSIVLTISVNDVPEPPTSIVLSSSSIDENSPDNAVVGTFSTTDPDSSDPFTYQLVTGDGADDNAAFTIVGNSLQINSSPDFETQSSYSIRVQTTDFGGASYSEVFTISVNDINESPTDIELSNRRINENSTEGTVVGTFGTTDPDDSDTFTYRLVGGAGADDNAAFTIVGDQLRINSSPDFETKSSYLIRVQTTDFAGVSYSEAFMINVNDVAEFPTDLVLSNNSINENSPLGAVVGTFSTTDPDNSDSFTYQLVFGNNAFTIVGDQLLTNSSLDFETQSTYIIEVQTTDSANNAFESVLIIDVNDVAESPTDINLSSSSIDSNSPLGAVVGTFSTTDPDEGDSFTYMLVSGNNAFTIVGDQLLTNSSLDFETQSSYSIRVQTTDSTNNALESVLIIDVNDVAESPTGINLSNSSINSNSPLGAVVGTFFTTDPDASDSFTYQLVSGAGADDNAAFSIQGNSLRINSSPDFETQSSYSIRVQTTDSANNSYSEVLTIKVNDEALNSSPTDIILSSSININENSPANTVVGTFGTTDPDNGDTFTYQLISGYALRARYAIGADDNAAFTIVGNQLRINSSPDFETQSSYSIRVQTTDSTGNSYSEVLIINVNDVGESPTDLVLSSSSINEDSLLGAVVGTFGTTDPDNGDTFTYQLISGYAPRARYAIGDDDNAAFIIVGDQLRINSSPDFETQEIYRIFVRTTDSTGNSYSEALIINVNNVAESPTDIVLSNGSINSNSRVGAIVGTFGTSDPDGGNTFTYGLISGFGDDDNAAFTIVGDQLLINSSPALEMRSSYSIRVQTTDVTGASYSEALIINVNDVAESPTDLNFSNTRQPLTLNPQPLTLSLFEKEEEDTLIGGEGRDRVYGNHGSDRLYEGSEANIFVLESDMMGTIIDFEDYTDGAGRDRAGRDFSGTVDLAIVYQGLDTLINFERETLATLQEISKIYVSDQNSTPLLPT